MSDDGNTDYFPLRKASEPPDPPSYADGVRFYVDNDAVLRYVLPDGTDAAVGGGGGSQPGVQVVTVPVSSAEILDLFNTPVVLIPGVAGNIIVVLSAALTYLAGLVPYLDGGGNIHVVDSCGNQAVQIAGAGFWDQPASLVAYPAPSFPGGTFGTGFGSGVDVTLDVNVANPTLGDGTLLVTLSYFLAPAA